MHESAGACRSERADMHESVDMRESAGMHESAGTALRVRLEGELHMRAGGRGALADFALHQVDFSGGQRFGGVVLLALLLQLA
jgi:hypothetical protein